MNSAADLSPPILMRVRGLTFSYPPQRHVLTDWSHDFNGGITWVRGSNGCGKSTLLKLLAGALDAFTGEVEVLGLHVKEQPLPYRRSVFFCGPGPIVFDHLSPTEFFGFMRNLYPSVNIEALAKHVQGFELHPFLNSPLSTLSTGTQRKVWLAIALCAGTPVTLLDEPLNALDAKSLAHLRSALMECAHDHSRAWIVVSHEALDAVSPLVTVLEMTPFG